MSATSRHLATKEELDRAADIAHLFPQHRDLSLQLAQTLTVPAELEEDLLLHAYVAGLASVHVTPPSSVASTPEGTAPAGSVDSAGPFGGES